MNHKTKVKIVRLIWYLLYVIVEWVSLVMLACQIPYNPLMVVIILTWVIMSIITIGINDYYRREED